MDYQWLHNIEEEAKKRKSTVHLLPTGDHRDGTEAIVLDDARGVLAIPDNFGDRRRAAKPGDGHKCEYSARREDGQCELCWTEHDYCNLLTPSGRCQVCYRAKQSCPEFETKPSFVVGKLVSLYQVQQKRESCPAFKTTHEYPDVERRPLKVIVFSQFRNVLNTIGDRLIRRCGTACIAEYWGSNRKKALHQFAKDIQCFCMLVGKDGSEGLDLSFVTNMIFLEQVYDKSLEEQVVARAWRMGAKGPVEVETLVAKDSVEELMARLDSDLKRGLQTTEIQGIRSATEKGKGSEYQSAKLHFLLMNLRLITRPDTNPLTAGPGGQAKGLLHLATDPAGPSGEVKAGKQQRVRFHDGTDVDIILNSS
jgi:SNF2 family DNA or RNA helicase